MIVTDQHTPPAQHNGQQSHCSAAASIVLRSVSVGSERWSKRF
jgi:hypothetical protein